jgi:hypothetical protein
MKHPTGHAVVFAMAWIIVLGGFLNVLRIMNGEASWSLLMGGFVLLVLNARRLRSTMGVAIAMHLTGRG